MVNLIPSPESVMQILEHTGAYRQGHFVFPNGKHASHYFQMPLAFRYYDNSRVLSVAFEPQVQNGSKRLPAVCRKFRLSVRVRAAFPSLSACAKLSARSRFTGRKSKTANGSFGSI